jgi:hypothetical protein
MISTTLNSLSGVNSQLFAFGSWHTDLAKAIVATCNPRHNHKYGIFFSLQKFAKFIIHSTPLSQNHHGTTIQAIFF